MWNPAQKILFRFFFLYLVLFTMTVQFVLSFLIAPLWEPLVIWLGNDVIGIDYFIRTKANGSGDRIYDYLFLLLIACISFLGMIIWSVADRKRSDYRKLYKWLEVLVRYYVIYQMLNYGLSKIFYLQMGPPGAERLSQTVGDMSPMGLVWTFVGYSKGFTMLTGWLEFAGAVLLMFRRTQTFGAMMVFGVMANVMAFNYFYDVPVKLLSTHIVLMSLFLMAPDAKRLWFVLVLNKPTEARRTEPLFIKRGWQIAKNVVKWGVINTLLIFLTLESWRIMEIRNNFRQSWGIIGKYEVDFYQEKGTNEWEWQTNDWVDFNVNRDGSVVVNKLDRSFSYHSIQVDEQLNCILLSNKENAVVDSLFAWRNGKTAIRLDGTIMQDTVKLKIHKVTPESFPLMQRGFHWVNEVPYNR